MKRKRANKLANFLCICICICSMSFLTGCSGIDSSTDMYARIENQTKQFSQHAELIKNDSVAYGTEKIYEAATWWKHHCWGFAAGFLVVGVWLLLLIREDQGTRKKVIIWFLGFGFLGSLITGFVLPFLVGAFL